MTALTALSGMGPVKHQRRHNRRLRRHREPAPPLIVSELRHRYTSLLMRRLGVVKIPLRLVRKPLPPTVTEENVNGHLVARVRITDDMMTAARDMAEKIQRSDSEAGFKESFAGRNIVWETAGMLGHLAAGEYLFGDWLKAVRSIEAGPDAADFTFQGRMFDVKTAGGERDRYLLVPVAKFEKRHPHVYVGAQVKTPREVWIWGYAAREEVADAPVKDFGWGRAYYIPMKQLHSIIDLVPTDASLLRYMTCTVSGGKLAQVLRVAEPSSTLHMNLKRPHRRRR